MSTKRIPGVKELGRKLAKQAQMVADQEIGTKVGAIVRGGKILWSALPWAVVADPTADPPVVGHVGAVQPDGVTTDVDPETGILTAAIPIDGVSTGTIAYFVEGTGWVLLPIS